MLRVACPFDAVSGGLCMGLCRGGKIFDDPFNHEICLIIVNDDDWWALLYPVRNLIKLS